MGLFTSKKVKWRRKVQAHAKSSANFRALEQTYGRPRAKEYLELFYTKAHDQNNTGILEIPTDHKASSFDVVVYLIGNENSAVLQRRQFYTGYMADSKSGTLTADLNNNLAPLPNVLGMNGRELAIEQAVQWIGGTYTACYPAVRALLKDYIPLANGSKGKFGPCLGANADELWKVHKKLVPDCASPTRLSTKFATKYPSTVGAKFLLDELYTNIAGQAVWPPDGDGAWDGIATFFLGSIGAIQAFPDGNKRMSRFAYSVIMINGTNALKIPTDAYALGLYRMQG